jgi:hypothetical protein
VICLFIKIIAELGSRDHRLTYMVPSYLLNDNRINTIIQHNIPEKQVISRLECKQILTFFWIQVHWQSAVSSTMLYLLENNLVNTLCIEGTFLEALNSQLKQNSASYSTVSFVFDQISYTFAHTYLFVGDSSAKHAIFAVTRTEFFLEVAR